MNFFEELKRRNVFRCVMCVSEILERLKS
jgi:hypothetical protein